MRWYDRLRRQSEIAHVRRRGRRSLTFTLAAYVADVATSRPQVGITVSKAVGKAVVRNLVRRRIRGALDMLGPLLPSGTALLVIARPEASAVPYVRIAGDVAQVVKNLKASRTRGA